MAFTEAVQVETPDLQTGVVIKASPHNTSAYERFENGLREGRFCKFDAGEIKNLSGSATPKIAGIVARKVAGEIGAGVYSTSGPEIDQVAEVHNFGFITVTTVDGITPTKYEAVNTINDATANAGKATNAAVAAGIISVGDAVFWEQKAANTWLVRINKYL